MTKREEGGEGIKRDKEKRGKRRTGATERRPHPWNPSYWLLILKSPPDDWKGTREAKIKTRGLY